MNTGKTILLSSLVLLGLSATQATAAPPARFVDLDKPSATASIGDQANLNIYADAGERGVKLYNGSDVAITVQDTVQLTKFVLEPGAQIGLSCDGARHLAIQAGDDVTYESLRCGSLLRFTGNGGQQ